MFYRPPRRANHADPIIVQRDCFTRAPSDGFQNPRDSANGTTLPARYSLFQWCCHIYTATREMCSSHTTGTKPIGRDKEQHGTRTLREPRASISRSEHSRRTVLPRMREQIRRERFFAPRAHMLRGMCGHARAV